MKNTLAVLAIGAIVVSASADTINFKWTGVDGDGTAADTLITSVGAGGQIDAIVDFTGNTVQLVDLLAPTWLDALAVQEVPSFLGGGVDTPSLTIFDMAYAGQFGQGIVVNGGVAYTSIADLQIGDTFDITTSRVFADAGVAPGIPENLSMAPQSVTIEVIPEPATLGLMGIAGLGMFLARKKARR